MEKYELKYKKALKWMRSLYGGLHGVTREEAEKYFPELKSEDERIRKGLIKSVSRIFEGHKLYDTDVTREEALAWLEKQDKKLDADKVIEWLKNNGWCTVGGPKVEMAQINKFKKDFEL